MPYGTLVEVISGKDDLLHIFEIGRKRPETVVLVKIVMIAGLAGSTETKIRSYTLIYNPGYIKRYPGFYFIGRYHLLRSSYISFSQRI